MLHLIDKKIRQAFSDAALEYDVLTSLHKEIGRELLAKLRNDDREFSFMLDVGMGTGRLTKRLAFYFPEAKVIGLDFSDGMIDIARTEDEQFRIVQANAMQLPFRPGSCDAIVSNLAYQWMDNLDKAFSDSHMVLKNGGRFLVTMFGHQTFRELFVTLQTVLGTEVLPIRRLAKREDILSALQDAGFSEIHLDYELIKVRFPDMLGLLKWIKDIGANSLTRDFYVGKDLLNNANDYYNQNFKDRLGAYTTFEVVWIDAKK
ncbi:MAG: methyltransferase domain-containing protein [Candidatus Omnitrophica bacterium]|nr:methyltransferase domain-containing protein [Candidatus Omnitrophota bacterium]